MNPPTTHVKATAIPKNKLHAYILPGAKDNVHKLIRSCQPRNDLMDLTQQQYAYRCIPMTAANTMGWELLSPSACEFLWDGLTPHTGIKSFVEQELPYRPHSHFGSGIITWDLPFIFRTAPGYGLVVTGPSNHTKKHILALDAFVRTDWLPFPFTMNWKITEANQAIRFEYLEPICRIFPYPLDLLDSTELELHNLTDAPDFYDDFKHWHQRRSQNYANQDKQQSTTQHSNQDSKNLWNSQYAKGNPENEDRQTLFKCQRPKDNRPK